MNRLKCPHMDNVLTALPASLNQLKKESQCHECSAVGPNFWICLQQNCLQIGCPENINDHNTEHFRTNPTHGVHMNVSSQRLWCYLCEREVFLQGSGALPPAFMDADRHYRHQYQDHPDTMASNNEEFDYGTISNNRRQFGGLVGLKNLANTCYMNAALQALSNSPPLTGYFLDCGSIVDTLQMQTPQQRKSELAKGYHRLVKEMWCRNRRSNGYVVPNNILHGIRVTHPMFRGYQQHDTQEFLRCFMDQLHEELKEATPPPPRDLDLSRARYRLRDASEEDRESNSSSPSPSEAEYETCDSGVSEQSQLSDLEEMLEEEQEQHYSSYRNKYSRSSSPSSSGRHGKQQQQQLPKSQSSNSTTTTSGTSSGDPVNSEPPVKSHRSIISDVFDGKLLSSVQCLTCDRFSTREETFQDLSLPIPGKDHLAVLHQSQSNYNLPAIGVPLPSTSSGQDNSNGYQQQQQQSTDGWFWWLFQWMRSWFWGPPVTLHDCMAAFFSADELKNDNMYSCEKCKKLRNGIKYSRVLALPEMLCVHLKRFRHDLSYSSKISSPVHFPLTGLDMRPYLHKDCRSEVSTYDLTAVICHHGTVGGGHYTCYAKHEPTGCWFEYDDQLVTKVSPETVQTCEPYVLFYRKTNPQMELLRAQAMELVDRGPPVASDIRFFVSKSWFNRFNTFAEPGPIDNWALLCPHGGLPPCKAGNLKQLVMPLPQPLWDFLYETFGGGPACNRLFECLTCKRAAESLSRRQDEELEVFTELKNEFHMQEPSTIYAISMHWFRQWQLFARGMTTDEPGPVNNKTIVAPGCDTQPIRNVRQGSDYAQIDVHLWRFFHGIYGGGPEIILRGDPQPVESSSRYSGREQEDMEVEEDQGETGQLVNGNITYNNINSNNSREEDCQEMGDQEQEGDNKTQSEAMQRKDRDEDADRETEEEEVVGDQPTVFGLTSKLKQTMSLADHQHHQRQHDNTDGQGDSQMQMINKEASESLVNGRTSVSSGSTGSERKKEKGAVAERVDKHRMTQTSGLFGVQGTFVKHSSEVDEIAEGSAPLMMDVNGDTARYTSLSEEVKKPQQQQRHSHGHGKGRHGRKGGRRN